MKTEYAAAAVYITKDGSLIRELLHPNLHGNRNQSLAEAIVESGATTTMHCHRLSEEIYHITAGAGLMTLNGECFAIRRGDTICIPPGSAHCVHNTGDVPLHILCCCAPPYSHEDTELLDNPRPASSRQIPC